MRTTSQCSPGTRPTTRPTPSTWPCIMCPPSRVCGVTARSRFTGAPAATEPRLLRLSVSAITSVLHTPSSTAVTVRHTPLTAMESPRATSCSTRSARICSTAESDWSSRTTSVPTSSTIPVNTSTPSVRALVPPSVTGGAQTDLHVPAQGGDLDDREGQRVRDRADSQVSYQRGAVAQQFRCEMGHDLVHEPVAQEGGGERGTALQQHAADAPVVQLGEQRGRALGPADVRRRGVVVQPGSGGHALAAVGDDPQRLMVGVPAVGVADGKLGVVGQHRLGPDDDGVARGPQPVDGGAGLLAGDPAAGAVGGGDPAVQGGGDLPHDERAV